MQRSKGKHNIIKPFKEESNEKFLIKFDKGDEKKTVTREKKRKSSKLVGWPERNSKEDPVPQKVKKLKVEVISYHDYSDHKKEINEVGIKENRNLAQVKKISGVPIAKQKSVTEKNKIGKKVKKNFGKQKQINSAKTKKKSGKGLENKNLATHNDKSDNYAKTSPNDISDEVDQMEDQEETNRLPHGMQMERNSRTIFVGNVSHEADKKKLRKLFRKYGTVEKVWIRGVVKAGKIPQKVTFIKKLFQKTDPPFQAYILFSNKQEATDALKSNGEIFLGHHIRVDMVLNKPDTRNECGIFVGNLPFNVTDEEIWEHFQECGEIDGVRVIRDKTTGVGKGFGYVNFKGSDSVELALQLNDSALNKRQLRVSRVNSSANKRKKNKTTKPKVEAKKKPEEGAQRRIKKKFNKENKSGTNFKGENADKLRKDKKKKPTADVKKKKLLAKILSSSKTNKNSTE